MVTYRKLEFNSRKEVRKLNDFKKLRGRIKEKLGSEANFAKAIGISAVSLSYTFSKKRYFSAEDIRKACQKEVLDIPKEEIGEYFF